jgi:hypothetical protein
MRTRLREPQRLRFNHLEYDISELMDKSVYLQ